jgi:translation initiation factor IF-3
LTKQRKHNQKVKFRVNQDILAHEVRVIDTGGKQIGVMPTKKAIRQAKEQNLDLVEIAPKAAPPVTKIADYGKLRYAAEKKLKKERKKTKSGELKEIRFSPFIAEQDYKTRLTRINQFLKDNHKVRVVVVFKGRQMGSKPFGYRLLEKVINELEVNIAVDMKPKFLGRHLAMIISPVKKAKNEKTKN